MVTRKEKEINRKRQIQGLQTMSGQNFLCPELESIWKMYRQNPGLLSFLQWTRTHFLEHPVMEVFCQRFGRVLQARMRDEVKQLVNKYKTESESDKREISQQIKQWMEEQKQRPSDEKQFEFLHYLHYRDAVQYIEHPSVLPVLLDFHHQEYKNILSQSSWLEEFLRQRQVVDFLRFIRSSGNNPTKVSQRLKYQISHVLADLYSQYGDWETFFRKLSLHARLME